MMALQLRFGGKTAKLRREFLERSSLRDFAPLW
jgi:hypothetical protein